MKNKPDYWYKQSSAIPFRIINEKVEVLIISTRKKINWIFPKGIVEPGLSARDSAVKEALEEAGVSGKLLSDKLGKYSYKKWGGKCKVKVYALLVNEIFDVWEEDFRNRKWIAVEDVSKFINDEKLLKIIAELNPKIDN